MENKQGIGFYQLLQTIKYSNERVKTELDKQNEAIELLFNMENKRACQTPHTKEQLNNELKELVHKARSMDNWEGIANLWVKDLNNRMGANLSYEELVDKIKNSPEFSNEYYADKKLQTVMDRMFSWAKNYTPQYSYQAPDWQTALKQTPYISEMQSINKNWSYDKIKDYIENRLKE